MGVKILIPTSFEEFSGKNLQFNYTKDHVNVFPKHPMVRNWAFGYPNPAQIKTDKTTPAEEITIDREEIVQCLEANLADALARVAEIHGTDQNDLRHLFPAVLRMLKSDSTWSK